MKQNLFTAAAFLAAFAFLALALAAPLPLMEQRQADKKASGTG